MTGTVTQRCACPTVKDAQGRLVLDAKGKAERDHRKGCKPKYGYVFDAAASGDGKRRQITKHGFATRKEAERELRAALEAEENGLRVDTGRLTVGEYLDEWLAGRHKLTPSTARSYEAHVRLYLKPALGRLRLSDVRHADVDRLLGALIADDRLTPQRSGACTPLSTRP